MCEQVFHIGLTCSMKSRVNPIGVEGVMPKIPILLRHNPKITLQKPIDRCRSAKLPLDTNFQLSGTRRLSI